MTEVESRTYQGKVKLFNGQFGFLHSEAGDMFFHRSGIRDKIILAEGDVVTFKVEPSTKKVGTLQAFDLILIKKHELALANVSEPKIGIVKWYDDEKGFGMIGTAESLDYFFHKSSLNILKKNIGTGTVVIFKEKTVSSKKAAIQCKVVEDYDDFCLAVNYLSKEDIVSIDVKKAEWSSRGGAYYSTETEQFSLLTSAANQILSTKSNEDRLKIVSDCFEANISYKSSDVQMRYFFFIKKTFESGLKNDCSEILCLFFNRFSKVVVNHPKLVYSLWLDDYSDTKDLSYLADEIGIVSITDYPSPLEKMFDRLNQASEQETVLKQFLTNIGEINNEEKYKRIEKLIAVSRMELNVKKSFVSDVFSRCDIERKYQMWFDGYIEEKDLNYIIKQISGESIGNYSNLSIIFKRLKDASDQEVVLNSFLSIIGEVNSVEKYTRIKTLLAVIGLDEKVKDRFLVSVFDRCDDERQYLLWLDGYTVNKNLFYISKQVCQETVAANSKTLKRIFEKLTQANEQEIVLRESHGIVGKICEDNYAWVKHLMSLTELDEKVKDLFVASVFEQTDGPCKASIFLDYWQYSKSNGHELITSIFDKLNIHSLYAFFLKLLDPLATFKYGSSYYEGRAVNERNFDIKIGFFKRIYSYMENNQNDIETKIATYINTSEINDTLNLLRIIKVFRSVQSRICDELQIQNTSKTFDVESYLIAKGSTSHLLKCWVYDLVEYFDFNSYCFYYFTLSLEERKIFNKKAKTKMSGEIKTSMLKKREPWQMVDRTNTGENALSTSYTATWKSIWFEDGFIRICMDKQPTFSKKFRWDFSEAVFNSLYEYISGSRLRELEIIASGDRIISIEGLDDLDELIWRINILREVESSGSQFKRLKGTNRIPVNMMVRRKSIQLLNNFQLNELQPARVFEKTFSGPKKDTSIDVSLLYSIPINKEEIAIIWESLEDKAKATHIFKCEKAEYESVFAEIKLHLSKNTKVRSTLNGRDTYAVEHQRKLRYLTRIHHDNFDFNHWRSALYEVLPDLRDIEVASRD